MLLNRRKLIGGLGLLVAAPAIVRAESLMKVKSLAHLEVHRIAWITPMPALMFEVQVSSDGAHWVSQKQVIPISGDHPAIITLPRPEGGRYFRFATSVSPAAVESAA